MTQERWRTFRRQQAHVHAVQVFQALLVAVEAADAPAWRSFQARASELAGRRARVRREAQDIERALWEAGVARRVVAQRARDEDEGTCLA